MPTLVNDWNFNFNNYTFGGAGTNVQIMSIDGLDDLPSLRVQDDNRGYADGAFTGRDFLNGRIITFYLQVLGDPSGNPSLSMQNNLAVMKSKLISQSTGFNQLAMKIPTRGQQYIYARVRKRTITIDPNYVYGRAFVAVEFFCPDPRFYDAATSGAALSPITLQGRTYPRVYPMIYTNTTGLTNSQAFINTGNYTTYPLLTFTGICSTPTITNLTTGATLSFNISLGSSDILVVDTDMRTVVLNGNTNVRNTLSGGSTWFGFPPTTSTASTTLVFTTVTYSISQPPTCTVAYHNANI
jgi:phage-related protein